MKKGRMPLASGPFFISVLMAGKSVLEPQLFLLEPVKQGVVGVGAVFFDQDLGMERRMLGCESLDMSFVHRSISFRWLSRDSSINKTRKPRFVSLDAHFSAGSRRAWSRRQSRMTGKCLSARVKR
jgi:hypothetical protein